MYFAVVVAGNAELSNLQNMYKSCLYTDNMIHYAGKPKICRNYYLFHENSKKIEMIINKLNMKSLEIGLRVNKGKDKNHNVIHLQKMRVIGDTELELVDEIRFLD